MKRFITFSTALLLTVSLSHAQMLTSQRTNPAKAAACLPMERTSMVNKVTYTAIEARKKGEVSASPRRTKANGVFYTRERGVMFMGYDKEGLGYNSSFLNYPPFHQPIFKNRTGTTNIKWFMNGNDYTDILKDPDTGDCLFFELPKTMVTDNGLNAYPIPILTKGNTSYFISEIDKGTDSANTYGTKITVTNYDGWDLAYNYCDMNTNILYGSGSIDPGTGGKNHNKYIYGTGTITFSDGSSYQSVGIAQVFPAPVSPFTCEEIGLRTMSNTTPIAAGKTLTMELRNVVTDNEGNKTYGDEIYETLVSTSNDVSEAWNYDDGSKVLNVCFHKKEMDDFGIESNVPFVLDKDFCILIYGVSNKGIDCGFMGITRDDADVEDIPVGEPLITDGKAINSFSYGDDISLQADFYGYFDKIEVPTTLYGSDNYGNVVEYADCNVLEVSNDGKTVINMNWPDVFGQYVYVTAARNLENNDEDGDYLFDEPSWVKTHEVVSTSSTEETGMYLVTFTFEPLPAGVTYRESDIYIKGRAIRSQTPIHVVQGSKSPDPIPTTVTLSASEVNIHTGGTAELPISIENRETVLNGYQFKVTLPDGITLAKDSDGDVAYTLGNRYTNKKNMQVNIHENGNGIYQMICFSLTNELITGSEGPVITLTLQASTNTNSGTVTGKISDISLSNLDGSSIHTDNVEFRINISSFEMGDVNHDTYVNVADVMLVVNKAIGNDNPRFHADCADVNGDLRIDVADVMGIVKIILANSAMASVPATTTNTSLSLEQDGNIYTLHIDNPAAYTAFQGTATLPAGTRVIDIKTDNKHKAMWNNLGGGRYNFVVFSLDGSTFENGTALVKIITDSEIYGASLTGVQFTNEEFETIVFSNVSNSATSIKTVNNAQEKSTIYNLQGVEVKQPNKGVYIRNGKKLVIK